MAKELPYFQFYPSEWLTGDITICSLDIQGLFINICCFYWKKDCEINKALLDQRFSNDKALLKQLFDIGIIKLDSEENIIIEFLDEQYNELSKKHKQKVDAGRKGGLTKTKSINSKSEAQLKQNESTAKAKRKHSLSNIDKDKDKDKDINSILMSELFSSDKSDLKNIKLNFQIPEKDNQSAKIAYQFWLLINENLQKNGISTTKHEKSIYKNWIPHIRYILDNNEATIDQLREIHHFLKTDLFWQKNILSTEKLRKQLSQILLTIKNSQHEKNKRNTQSSSEQRKSIAEKKNYKTTFD